MIKTKNTAAANDVATKADLIKNNEIKTEKILMSMSVTVDDKININKFERKRSDQWHLKDMNTQNKQEKKMRKLNVY